VLFGTLLPGCPPSDNYVIDTNAGGAGGGAVGGGAAVGGAAGVAVAGAAAVGGSASMTGGAGGSTSQGGAGDVGGSGGRAGAFGATGGGDSGTLDLPDSCSEDEYDGHTYVLCVSTASSDAVGADDAERECASIRDDLGLAWIESSVENDFLREWIMDTAPSDGVVWMGANDQLDEGVWVWGRQDGAEQFYSVTNEGQGAYMGRFAYFGSGQPGSSRGIDEDCAAFDARVDWHWSDRGCDEAMVGFVCEAHPIP
jgi:hypothetical protein